MSDKPVVLLMTQECAQWALSLEDMPSAVRMRLQPLASGQSTCVSTAELARLRARVAELESCEPVAEVTSCISGCVRWLCESAAHYPNGTKLYAGPQRMTEREAREAFAQHYGDDFVERRGTCELVAWLAALNHAGAIAHAKEGKQG